MRELGAKIREIFLGFRSSVIMRLVFLLFLVILSAAVLVYIVESVGGNTDIRSLGDAMWWAIVTMTTVGYGDISPITPLGRVLAVGIMVSGISLSALFTAQIASYFVEKRIREGKGMEEIKFKKHVIICGWNSRAMSMVKKLLRAESPPPPLVFINELPEEHIANILRDCKDTRAKYVRGDYVHEGVLNRANVRNAIAVVLLIDRHGTKHGARADDRTVLAAYTIKGMNSAVRVCAEVESPETTPHLRRAGVETIVALGGHNDFMLANAAMSPGVTLAVEEMLTSDFGHLLQQQSFPSTLVDRPFGEAIQLYRSQGGLLLGVVREEEEGMSLDDILSGDMSAIDRFIKKKFEGMENTYFKRSKRLTVNINPSDDYVIKPGDKALVIAHEDKSQ